MLRQIFRGWVVSAYMDLLWMTKDVKQALVYLFSDTMLNIAGVSTTLLLAARFDGIGTWSRDQIIFMLGYATTVQGILDTFFNFNVLEISRRIGRGQLDHVLIQPRPIWMTLLTEGFVPFSGSGSLVAGIGIMIWAANRLSLSISAGWYGILLLSFAASCGIVLAFSYLWGSLAFWSPRGAEEICSNATEMMSALRSFPLDGVGPALTFGLLSVVPVGFVAWFPCRALLGLRVDSWSFAVTPVVALVFCFLVSLLFRKGMREYGRTGSQRYLSLGHRR